jgi:hypothetical protein
VAAQYKVCFGRSDTKGPQCNVLDTQAAETVSSLLRSNLTSEYTLVELTVVTLKLETKHLEQDNDNGDLVVPVRTIHHRLIALNAYTASN